MSGTSYDNPMRITYGGVYDWGNAGDLSAIPIPSGMTRCRVEDISVSATEVFNGTAKVELGIIGNTDRYAELNLLTLADTDGLSMDKATEAFDIGHGGKGVIDITTEDITQIELTLVAASSTGIGFLSVTIAWW